MALFPAAPMDTERCGRGRYRASAYRSPVEGVIQTAWTNGGNPTVVLIGGAKVVISTFTGNATRFKKAEDKRLVAAIDVYEAISASFDRPRSLHGSRPRHLDRQGACRSGLAARRIQHATCQERQQRPTADCMRVGRRCRQRKGLGMVTDLS